MIGPRRIVCLTEETTETLYLLGEQERIVGISAFTVRPPEAKAEKPVVSQFVRAKIDEIEALRPDLILAFSDIQADICADLIKRGLPVHCFNQRTVSGIVEMIRLLGRMIGAAEKAADLARRLEGNMSRARDTANKLPFRPRVFFEEWTDPIITGIRWVSEIIEIVGGIDCFADKALMSLAEDRTVTPQEVIDRNPDLYLASWCGNAFRPQQATARQGFADASFTQDGRMFEIPSSIILQPGPACLTDGLSLVQEHIVRVATSENYHP